MFQPRSFRSFVLAVLILPAVAACGGGNQYQPPPPPIVTVAQPQTREVADYLFFTGYTRATDTVDIRARVNGYLKSVEFKDGAMVKEGELLFVIEPEPFEIALAAAQATLQKAEARLGLAEAELKRTEPLVKRGALTEQELDIKQADLATAKAEVASAKAAVRQAEWNLDYTKVRAPLSGRISRHLVDVGNLVQGESTVLTRIDSFQPIYVYFTVSENEMLKLMQQRHAGGIDLRDQPLHMALAGEQDFSHEGRLDFSEVTIDSSSGTQMRRAIFPNEDGQLVPGLFCRVRLRVTEPAPRLMVPERAIAADQRGEYVLVVNDKKVVEYRPVKLGITVEGMRVVESGIESGEWVVVNGLQRARPGATVDPQPEQGSKESPAQKAVAAAPAKSEPVSGEGSREQQ